MNLLLFFFLSFAISSFPGLDYIEERKRYCKPKWIRNFNSFVGNIKWRLRSVLGNAKINIGQAIFGDDWRISEELKLSNIKAEWRKGVWRVEDYFEDFVCET